MDSILIPYEPPETDSAKYGLVGTLVGALALTAATTPSLYLLYELMVMHAKIIAMEAPPQNLRPIGGIVFGVLGSVVGFAILTPLSLYAVSVAERFGSATGTRLAQLGALMFVLPLLIGYLGPLVVIAITGAELGS